MDEIPIPNSINEWLDESDMADASVLTWRYARFLDFASRFTHALDASGRGWEDSTTDHAVTRGVLG